MRFPHWASHRHPGSKLRHNPQLNLGIRKALPSTHDYIVFKNYTGNEILYNLIHVAELRPSEISSALLEIGVRKGVPADYDWNTNELILQVVEYTKQRIPQYDSRVLTSLAHAFARLNITDRVLWKSLSTHIIRTCSTIDPNGLAYTFNAFVGKGVPEYYDKMMEKIPMHVRYMNGRDLLNVVRGLVLSDIPADNFFDTWLYPLIIEKKKMCNPKQLEEYLSLLSRRKDFTEENKKLMQEALEYKIERARRLSVQDLRVDHRTLSKTHIA